MMRALAEYIMRGRMAAISVALLGFLIPLLTPGAIGLVTLRKGWQEGLVICLWVSLPLFLSLALDKGSTAAVIAALFSVVVSFGAAWVLRVSISWPAAMWSIVALSGLGALIASFGSNAIMEYVIAFFSGVTEMAETEQEKAFYESIIAALSETKLAGILACFIAAGAIAGLVMARWWQALLYNPGGFQKEFHALRLTPKDIVISVPLLGLCLTNVASLLFFAVLVMMPLAIAGLGLVHNCAKSLKDKASLALGVVYFAVVFQTMFAILLLSIIGLTDVWLNYRKRFNLV